MRLGLDYRRSFEPVAGKHHALNTALADVTTPIVVTVDADTLLHPEALTYLIARVTSRPQDQHVCACAGALIAENANHNFLTRMQGWDYRLGINGVKRTQAAYNSALVAQGAFSAYWTDDIRAVGGWPDAIGEDIVLTWSLMASRGLVQYEPVALAETVVPERLSHFMRQRSRWARGMIEGIRINPPHRQPRVLAKFVAGIDYLVPAARHRLRVLLGAGRDPVHLRLPAAVLVVVDARASRSRWSSTACCARWQDRNVFRVLDMRPEPDRRGFFGYLLGYQALTSAASLRGLRATARGSRRGAGSRRTSEPRIVTSRPGAVGRYREDGLRHADTPRRAGVGARHPRRRDGRRADRSVERDDDRPRADAVRHERAVAGRARRGGVRDRRPTPRSSARSPTGRTRPTSRASSPTRSTSAAPSRSSPGSPGTRGAAAPTSRSTRSPGSPPATTMR